ncbi:2-C-methyl-D-erythritol 4-phosphate cytidylyltransferase [Vibrio sp. F74]|uniref:2-C-methyl-D-erythritol 4-phosphate cytidylyltransferase n=1 Tax=Vibrio sp. F74 TaxID=700020 RepID=UPI0035F5E12C
MTTPHLKPLYAIVPAAGIGSRMKADLPKQYLKLHNKTILEHTVDKLLEHPCIDKVIIAVSDDDTYFTQLSLASNKNVIRVIGGLERADSVLSGLDYLLHTVKKPDAWVLVHDAARPCIDLADIDKLIKQVMMTEDGGILAAPVRDTMKRGNRSALINETVERENLWHALTPQMFKVQPLRDALFGAIKAGINITDEASAMEWAGCKPKLVVGRMDNFKITQPEDLALAAFYLGERVS